MSTDVTVKVLRKEEDEEDEDEEIDNWRAYVPAKNILEGEKRAYVEYKNLEKVSGTGMARVYHAKRNNRQVTLKLYVTTSIESTNKFTKELKIIQTIKHENIIQLNDSWVDSKYYYLELEYCNGGDLWNWIETNGPMDELMIQHIAYSLLDCFATLHSFNYCHRDLKPENIVLIISNPQQQPQQQQQQQQQKEELKPSLKQKEENEKKENELECDFNPTEVNIRLIDFGEALKVSLDQLYFIENANDCYFAPELWKGINTGLELLLADIWAVGIILIELINGCRCFDCKDTHLLRQAVAHFQPSFSFTVSEECKNFVQLLTVADTTKRPNAKEALKHPWMCQMSSFDCDSNLALTNNKSVSNYVQKN